MPETVQGGAQAALDAFEQHVVPEIDVLLRVATSITGNIVDAEDLVQDTLLRAYRGIAGFDGRYPRAWLLTILRNAQRNRVRRRRPELLDDPDTVIERLADHAWHGGNVETIVVEATLDDTVAAAYLDLPPRFRRVVELVDITGLTYKEAAEVLGIPTGTVMSRLHRARHRIRERLEAAGMTGGRVA